MGPHAHQHKGTLLPSLSMAYLGNSEIIARLNIVLAPQLMSLSMQDICGSYCIGCMATGH